MGTSGIRKFEDGLTVAYLSGKDSDIRLQDRDSDHPQYFGNYFIKKDVEKIIEDFNLLKLSQVDLFITSVWPAGIPLSN